MNRRTMPAALALGLVACSGGEKPASANGMTAGANGAAAVGAGANGLPSTAKSSCVHDGTWRACGLVDRLERSGLVVKAEPDTVRYDFLSVPGVHYSVGRGDVQAFFYDDTLRLAKDVAALDTIAVAPKGTARHWDAAPTFARSQNLVVILLSGNEHLAERVQLAIEAGAPQPEPPPLPQGLPAVRAP